MLVSFTVPPLVKYTRDRLTVQKDQAYERLRERSSWVWVVGTFIVAAIFAVHALLWGLGVTSDDKLGLMLCMFFLLCSVEWLTETVRDRTDADLWRKHPIRVDDTPDAVRSLAAGTAFHAWLSVIAGLLR